MDPRLSSLLGLPRSSAPVTVRDVEVGGGRKVPLKDMIALADGSCGRCNGRGIETWQRGGYRVRELCRCVLKAFGRKEARAAGSPA